jgi:predicted enzyme related to lactoylglutathione lyase
MWVDLASPELEKSRVFYSKLFGWEAHMAPQPEAGGYTMMTFKGKQVAGMGATQGPGQPPAWSMYVATENADETAKKVREAGGKVIAEPFDVMDAGRMAVFQDPTGAFFSVWQPREHKGAELVNEPGSSCWNELATRDMAKAKPFYKKVFGWDTKDNPMGDSGFYTEWLLSGKSIAGGMPMGPQFPANVPPHWLTYFAVADCDAAVIKAGELGAKVLMPATDTPAGRFAVLSDPQGAAFAVIKV